MIKGTMCEWLYPSCCAWSDEDIAAETVTANSYQFYNPSRNYSLLFLEEKVILSKRVNQSPGTLYKMLLTDKDKYSIPKIIWVKPSWINQVHRKNKN